MFSASLPDYLNAYAKLSTRLLIIFFALLPACSFSPTAREKEASYQRTKTPLSYPGGDFGSISDRSLTLTLNQSLLWGQAVQQCDQKPVAYQTNDPAKLREAQLQQRKTNKTCRRKDDFISCAISKVQLDNAKEDMNDVRYQQDCYMAAPPAELAGKLQLRLVSQSTNSASYSAAPILAEFSLTQEAKPVTLDIPGSTDGQGCLALTDIRGTPVRVRNSDGDNYTFATAQMRSRKDRIALQNNINAMQTSLEKQKALVQNLAATLQDDPLLRRTPGGSYQCDKPSMRPLPPAPSGISLNEAVVQAQGYCLEKLANNFNPGLVFEYIIAAEEDQYASSYKIYEANKNSCTRKAYEYDPVLIQAMRAGSAFNPRENEKRQVIGLLEKCSQSVAQKCGSHVLAWQREIERIQEEPEKLYDTCNSKISDVSAASTKLDNMSAQITSMKSELATLQQNPSIASAASIPLSQAMCDAHQ